MQLKYRTHAHHAFHVTEHPTLVCNQAGIPFLDDCFSIEAESNFHLLWWIDHTGTLYEVRRKKPHVKIILRHFVPV